VNRGAGEDIFPLRSGEGISTNGLYKNTMARMELLESHYYKNPMHSDCPLTKPFIISDSIISIKAEL
jgi:hypothetical protein